MSASREKRERKITKKPAPLKKSHKLRNGLIIGVVALLLVYMAASSLKMFHRTFAAVSVGDVSFTAAEANMHFNLVLQQYGFSREDVEMYKSYFLQQAQTTMQNEAMLSREAQKNGMTLSAENKQMIDDTIAYIREQAKLANVSFQNLMALNYGEGVTESVFRKVSERSMLAYQWQEKKGEEFTASTAESETYYAEHPDDINKAVYYSYAVTWTTAEDATEDEIAAAKEEARVKAQTVNNSITSLDSFYEEIALLAPDTAPSSLVRTSYLSNLASQTDLYNFLKDDARKSGDHALIEADSSYSVVVFESLGREEYVAPSYYSMTIMPSDASDAASLQEARAKADAILQEWQAGAKTEESFVTLAAQRVEEGVVTNNGLIENVTKTFTGSADQAWLFDSARTAGDAVVVDLGGAYGVFYFVRWSDKPYWEVMAGSMIINEKYNEYTTQLAAEYPYKTRALGQLFVTDKEEPVEPSPTETVEG